MTSFASRTASSPWPIQIPTWWFAFIQTTAVVLRSPPTSTPTQIASPLSNSGVPVIACQAPGGSQWPARSSFVVQPVFSSL